MPEFGRADLLGPGASIEFVIACGPRQFPLVKDMRRADAPAPSRVRRKCRRQPGSGPRLEQQAEDRQSRKSPHEHQKKNWSFTQFSRGCVMTTSFPAN